MQESGWKIPDDGIQLKFHVVKISKNITITMLNLIYPSPLFGLTSMLFISVFFNFYGFFDIFRQNIIHCNMYLCVIARH